MGMFDEIKIEYEMPDHEIQDEIFQTKSFYNAMDNYTLTKEGKLIFHKCHYDMVPEEERPFYGKPEWDENTFYHTMGCMRTIYDGDVVMDYHGIIEIHTILGKYKDDGSTWYSYNLKFTDGVLVDIERNK